MALALLTGQLLQSRQVAACRTPQIFSVGRLLDWWRLNIALKYFVVNAYFLQ